MLCSWCQIYEYSGTVVYYFIAILYTLVQLKWIYKTIIEYWGFPLVYCMGSRTEPRNWINACLAGILLMLPLNQITIPDQCQRNTPCFRSQIAAQCRLNHPQPMPLIIWRCNSTLGPIAHRVLDTETMWMSKRFCATKPSHYNMAPHSPSIYHRPRVICITIP